MAKELVERFGDFTTNVSVSVVSQSSTRKGNLNPQPFREAKHLEKGLTALRKAGLN
jgi:hypothetical protein